jgi:hypothetical protein
MLERDIMVDKLNYELDSVETTIGENLTRDFEIKGSSVLVGYASSLAIVSSLIIKRQSISSLWIYIYIYIFFFPIRGHIHKQKKQLAKLQIW